MPFKAEVIADGSGEWVGNALVFQTVEEAEAYVANLARRWTLVRATRVVEVDDESNLAPTNDDARRGFNGTMSQ